MGDRYRDFKEKMQMAKEYMRRYSIYQRNKNLKYNTFFHTDKQRLK